MRAFGLSLFLLLLSAASPAILAWNLGVVSCSIRPPYGPHLVYKSPNSNCCCKQSYPRIVSHVVSLWYHPNPSWQPPLIVSKGPILRQAAWNSGHVQRLELSKSKATRQAFK